jgi:NADH dehydrogenase FAD-containing subunit
MELPLPVSFSPLVTKDVTMNKKQKILIIGGGFAGARVAQDLVKAGLLDVTLVDRKDYFEVTYAMLRCLAGADELATRARMRYEDFMKSKFILGEVSKLAENSATLDDGSELAFDYAIVASGSSYRTFHIAKSFEAKTLDARHQEFDVAQKELEVAKEVTIIGGGSVGVELAGEIAFAYPDKSIALIEGGPRLLGGLTPKASATATKQLENLGVNVLLNTMLQEGDSALANAEVVYHCLGLTPNTDLMAEHFSSSLNETGRIKADKFLRMAGKDHIFAIGDCADVPEGKLGYNADRQGAAVAKNILCTINKKRLKAHKPSPMMALVPTGQKTGLVQLPFGVTTLRFMVNMKQKDLFISKQFGNLGVKR